MHTCPSWNICFSSLAFSLVDTILPPHLFQSTDELSAFPSTRSACNTLASDERRLPFFRRLGRTGSPRATR